MLEVIEGKVVTRMVANVKKRLEGELHMENLLVRTIVRLFLDRNFSIIGFDATHNGNLTISFADTPKSRRELDKLYDQLIPTVGLGMKLYRRVNANTHSNRGRVYYKELVLELEGGTRDDLDDHYHTLKRVMDGEVEVDMSRIHVSKNGRHYPLPSGVSKYGYGYKLQYYAGNAVNFSYHEYGDLDGAFEGCVNYLKTCLVQNKLPVGCQVKESKTKKHPTGMAGVYATMQHNSSTARISVTVFQPKGNTKNQPIGNAVIDTHEYWELLREAKRVRIASLADEAKRQYESLPNRVL